MSGLKNSKWYFVVGGLTVLAIVTAVIVSAIPAAFARPSQQSDGGLPRSITVVGTGSASAAPDLATAQIGVDTQAASPEEATRDNDARMTALVDALKAAGIDAKDIQTAYYNLYAEQRFRPETGEPTGEFTYRVSSSVSVKIRDLANVGAILSDAVTAGANNISGVYFSIEDTSALEAVAREKAVADAEARAEPGPTGWRRARRGDSPERGHRRTWAGFLRTRRAGPGWRRWPANRTRPAGSERAGAGVVRDPVGHRMLSG